MSIRYGLIAAGEGSRLASEGISVPKPLVKVGGEELIGRMIRIFQQNDAESVSVIINDRMPEVYDYLTALKTDVPLDIVVKSTPSSLHSFGELRAFFLENPAQQDKNGHFCIMPYLRRGSSKFCLTTTDSVFSEREFHDYIKYFTSDTFRDDALMGVTDYIDDEKPLYVRTDFGTLEVTGYENQAYEGCKYISGGIYCMNQKALELLPKALDSGVERMRGFQRYMIEQGMKLQAYPFSKVIDIDHAADIAVAEEFLKTGK